MKTVRFYFDVGSPTAYLASTQLPALCAQAGASLDARPILLGAVFRATGNRTPAEVPAKARYMLADLGRFAQRYGVPFMFNPSFPINTLPLMRLVTAVQMHRTEQFEHVLRVVFAALWIQAANLADAAVLRETLASAGCDATDLLALAEQQDVKDGLRARTEEAVALGVFGVPTLFVGETMFFGQDRLDFVREALQTR